VGPKSDMAIEIVVGETSLGLGCCSYQKIRICRDDASTLTRSRSDDLALRDATRL
jgi:hypothetical protein